MTRFISATYHPNIKVAEFIADDGRHLLRSGGSLPWRTHNIGNLVSPLTNGAPMPKKTTGFIGFAKPKDSDHHLFIFPDDETGRAQLKASLLRLHKNKPLNKLVAAYAPKHDGNDTAGYTRKLSKLTGIASDSKVGDLSEKQLESLMDGIARLEGYHADEDTRKEIWVNVSNIQATDGTRPIADEEIVLRTNGKETTLKSNTAGQFGAIPHSKDGVEVLHKTADGKLKKVGDLAPDQGQQWSLLTKLSEFFGTTAPIEPPADAPQKKQPVQYVVQPGDSLSKIAKRFDTTVANIKQANHLTRDTIWPSQSLSFYSPSTKAHPIQSAPQATQIPSSPQVKQTPTARSNQGTGELLALIQPTQQRAPWMTIAFKEAVAYAGKDEKEITKTHNYHRLVTATDRAGGKTVELIGADGKPLKNKSGQTRVKTTFNGAASLVSTPWCASFVNYCLREAGYAAGRRHMSSYTFGTDKDLFVKIKKPIFGAIRFSARAGGGHVCFVYGKIGNKLIILGGNQSDQLCFQLRDTAESASYYVPAPYAPYAETQLKEDLPIINLDELRRMYGVAVQIEDSQIKALKTAKGSES